MTGAGKVSVYLTEEGAGDAVELMAAFGLSRSAVVCLALSRLRAESKDERSRRERLQSISEELRRLAA